MTISPLHGCLPEIMTYLTVYIGNDELVLCNYDEFRNQLEFKTGLPHIKGI
jgi:hypothetical protein